MHRLAVLAMSAVVLGMALSSPALAGLSPRCDHKKACCGSSADASDPGRSCPAAVFHGCCWSNMTVIPATVTPLAPHTAAEAPLHPFRKAPPAPPRDLLQPPRA